MSLLNESYFGACLKYKVHHRKLDLDENCETINLFMNDRRIIVLGDSVVVNILFTIVFTALENCINRNRYQ